MSRLALIPVGPDSAARVAGLHGRCFADAWDAASVAKLMGGPGALALVLAEDGEDAAFALFHAVPPEAELLSVGTIPERRGRRLGEAVLRGAGAILAARGVEVVFLDVAARNAPARALYARLGFRERGRRPNYYRDGDDALGLAAEARVIASPGLS